jgi:DNA-binding CsgD family transcriptional regulator
MTDKPTATYTRVNSYSPKQETYGLLQPREHAVLSLWDDGLGVGEISAELGMTVGNVRRIITDFDGKNDYAEMRRDMAHGSRLLADAIIAARSVNPAQQQG